MHTLQAVLAVLGGLGDGAKSVGSGGESDGGEWIQNTPRPRLPPRPPAPMPPARLWSLGPLAPVRLAFAERPRSEVLFTETHNNGQTYEYLDTHHMSTNQARGFVTELLNRLDPTKTNVIITGHGNNRGVEPRIRPMVEGELAARGLTRGQDYVFSEDGGQIIIKRRPRRYPKA